MEKDIEKSNVNIKLENDSNTIKEESIKSQFKLNNDGWVPDDAKQGYHEQRLSQSKWAFRLSFWGSIVGVLIIIKYLGESIAASQMEWVGIASGTIIEAVSALFFHLSNKANEKITEFFTELTKDSNVKEAIKLADGIKNDDIRDELRVKLSLHLAGIDDDKICKNTKDICNTKENT